MYWLGVCFELSLSVAAAREAQKFQEAAMTILKPSQMNRLQRSMISAQHSAVAKDSTARVASFLSSTLQELQGYLQVHVEMNENWIVSFPILFL